MSHAYQSLEGFGAIILRNQVPLFISSWYNVPFEFHGGESAHGYNISDLFGKCQSPPPLLRDFQGIREHRCTIDLENIILPQCRVHDCKCFQRGIEVHVNKAVARGCPDITVRIDGFKRYTYLACLRPLMEKYLGWKNPKPTWEYDVVHYRLGDLEVKGGGKKFSMEFMETSVDILCRSSKRDIIVLTEGSPKLPTCEDRVVLAADTSIEHAMQIMQFAKTAVVGKSSFSFAMMIMSQAESVIMERGVVEKYFWLHVEKWYLVEEDYGVFHYESKKHMMDDVTSYGDLRKVIFRKLGDIKPAPQFFQPNRTWSVQMMK